MDIIKQILKIEYILEPFHHIVLFIQKSFTVGNPYSIINRCYIRILYYTTSVIRNI